MLQRCLGFLEKIMRTDIRYLLKGGFFLSLTQVSSAGIGFILTIAFANLLSQETYGTYRYVLSVYAMISILALPGIDTAVIQSVSRGYDWSFLTAVEQKIKWGLLGSITSIAVGGYYYFHDGNTSLAISLFVVGIILPFMESFSLYTSYLNGKRDFAKWALLDIIVQVVSASTLILTILFTKNLIFITLAYFLPYTILRTIYYFYIKNRYILKVERKDDNELLSYGKSVTLFQVLSRATNSIDQIVLFNLLGPAQVAVFALAQAIPSRIQSLLRISGSLAFPKFTERSAGSIAEALPRKILVFTVVIVIGAIIYVLIAPTLFTLLFPKYLASLSYSQVLIFATIGSITYPFSAFLFAHKRMKENYIFAVSSIVIKVVALFTLVPIIGIWGAVVGVVLTSIATIAISIYLLFKERRDGKNITPA